jgi:hypothetical protein
MAQDAQNRRNLARVTGNRHKQVLLSSEKRRGINGTPNLVERVQRTRILTRAALGRDAVPQLVTLGEPRLETVLGPGSVDIRSICAVIARMD